MVCSTLKEFQALTGESISERKVKKFEKDVMPNINLIIPIKSFWQGYRTLVWGG